MSKPERVQFIEDGGWFDLQKVEFRVIGLLDCLLYVAELDLWLLETSREGQEKNPRKKVYRKLSDVERVKYLVDHGYFDPDVGFKPPVHAPDISSKLPQDVTDRLNRFFFSMKQPASDPLRIDLEV